MLVGGQGSGFNHNNTLLKVSGKSFLENPNLLQTEAFGPVSLIILAENVAEMISIASQLEGNLTGCIYSDTKGSDDDDYALLAPILQTKVGRLLNDKMPTGVAVSPAMVHGGPYPATGHSWIYGRWYSSLNPSFCCFEMLRQCTTASPSSRAAR